MNSKNLLLLSLLVLLLVCCRNKDETEPQYIHTTKGCDQIEYKEIDNSLMQQFLFKPGTYWIYKDSVDSSIDSCYCYGPKIKLWPQQISGGMGSPLCYAYYHYAIDSTNQQDSFRYTYYIQDKYMRVLSPAGVARVNLCSNESGNLTGDSLSVFYPTITINGTTYSNVYKFHFKTYYGKFTEGYFYMKPGLGIIKTVLHEIYPVYIVHVHELVRHHIE